MIKNSPRIAERLINCLQKLVDSLECSIYVEFNDSTNKENIRKIFGTHVNNGLFGLHISKTRSINAIETMQNVWEQANSSPKK